MLSNFIYKIEEERSDKHENRNFGFACILHELTLLDVVL